MNNFIKRIYYVYLYINFYNKYIFYTVYIIFNIYYLRILFLNHKLSNFVEFVENA